MAEVKSIEEYSGALTVGFGDNTRLYAMQSFHAVHNNVTAVGFEITSAPPVADITVYFDTSTGDEPDNTLISGAFYNFTIDNGDITPGPGQTKYDLPEQQALTIGNEYCFYLAFSVSEYRDFVSSVSNPYTDGVRKHYNNSTSNWDIPDSGNLDFNFTLWATEGRSAASSRSLVSSRGSASSRSASSGRS